MKSVKQFATSFLSAACLAHSALFAAEPATAAFNPDSVVKSVEKALAPLKEQVAKEDLAYKNTRIFEVLAYGAIADGKTLNTQAIQKAIDACAAAGGGRVHFTKGDYLTGTIILKAGTVLDLDEGARILGSTKLADYPSTPDQFPALYQKMFTQSLIYAEKADGVGIRGKGELDMQGGSFPGHETVGGLPGRPFMIRMTECNNVRIEGVTLRNSASWMESYIACDNLVIRNLKVQNFSNFNNDGIDVDGCRNVWIANCNLATFDDCLCFKGTSTRPTENVLVEDCKFYSNCNALKMGTDSQGGFRNALFRRLEVGGADNSKVENLDQCKVLKSRLTGNGFAKTYCNGGITWQAVDGMAIENIVVMDSVINQARSPIFLRLGDRGRFVAGDPRAPAGAVCEETRAGLMPTGWRSPVGSMKNIAFINITGERNGDIGCPVAGIPGHRIENVLFKNIALGVLGGGSKEDAARTPPELAANYPEGKMFGKLPAHGIYFRHVDGAVVENVRFKTKSNDARPAFAGSDALNVIVDGTPLVGNPVTTPQSTTFSAPDHAISKPNVIIILADDLGYGDVKCYNPERGKIPTPNIDKLASQGMRFTDAHTSSGVCSPTRYALLTGRYHWRSRLQSGIVGYLEDPLIAPGRLTLASLLKQHGYRTGAIGKWHLGWDFQLTADERKRLKSYGGKWGGGGKVNTAATDEDRAAWRTTYARQFRGGPVTLGFDSYFGTDLPNWPPYCFIENDRTVGIPSELLAADALRKNQASLQGPALAGWKLEDVLPALEERACAFIQNAAKAPEPFFLYLPLTAPHTPIATTKEWRGKSGLNDYADFVMQTDATIGRVLQALEQSGAAENTLVVFTSDNGCAPYVGAAELEKNGHFPSGPLRGYKADAWEGGHRVPFIVRWPGNVKPDTRCDALVAQADLMATLAETLDAKLPDNAGEDSYSLMPLLKGGDKPVREYAISHGMNGLPALRKGSWKIIFGQKGGGYGEAPGTAATGQLYDLATDLGETKNLWKEQPELVAELAATMTRLVADGRSTPGEKQQNDVPVRWQRFLERSSPAK